MPVNKGAPLRALFTIVALWILGRIVWEVVSPDAQLQPIPVVKAKGEVPNDILAAKPSVSLPLVTDRSIKPTNALQHQEDRTSRVSLDLQSRFLSTVSSMQQAERLTSLGQSKEQPEPEAAAKDVFVLPRPIISELKEKASQSQSSEPLSGYFWTFVRPNSGSERFGPAILTAQSPGGQYGGSQAGAILTYRLAGDQSRSLSTFVRASTALSSAGQEEMAIGIKAKPWTSAPVSLFAEKRVGVAELGSRGAAVYLAGGTGPDLVMADTSLETYGQAGFVFADDSSYFFDASAALQTKLIERGNFKMTAGAGIWAGGQEGVTRLDVGPRASFHVPIGEVDMRFSVDWRQRVGGNAIPGSGVAVTFTTGF